MATIVLVFLFTNTFILRLVVFALASGDRSHLNGCSLLESSSIQVIRLGALIVCEELGFR